MQAHDSCLVHTHLAIARCDTHLTCHKGKGLVGVSVLASFSCMYLRNPLLYGHFLCHLLSEYLKIVANKKFLESAKTHWKLYKMVQNNESLMNNITLTRIHAHHSGQVMHHSEFSVPNSVPLCHFWSIVNQALYWCTMVHLGFS